jgi:hypothetical protein
VGLAIRQLELAVARQFEGVPDSPIGQHGQFPMEVVRMFTGNTDHVSNGRCSLGLDEGFGHDD